ncbi:MAG: PorT family protein [Muribaculaceae bacterium]|nr:PorT family protein [Muribaculaceae bacterium]
MKKLFAIIIIAVSVLSASAQMMTSRTLMKRENPTTWYVRLGLGINSLNGPSGDDKDYYDVSTGSKAGFDIDFGFNKPMGKSGAYWGMDLGLLNRGGTVTSDDSDTSININTWSIKYSPLMFGYKYSITDDIKIDGHLSGYLLADVSQKAKYGDRELDSDAFDSSFDAGVQIGIGVWYKKFNFDLSYQRGFIPLTGSPNLTTSTFLIRVGYAF